MKRNLLLTFMVFLGVLSNTKAQGNLPYQYTFIEYNGELLENGEARKVCSQNGVDANITLNAEYLLVGSSTSGQYAVESIPFTTVYPQDGLAVNLTIDDRFSPAVTLPFDFCFFGQVNNSFVCDANGRIVFNPALADQGSGWAISAAQETAGLPFFGNLTAATSGSGQIFGVYQDTDPSDNEAVPGVTSFNFGVYGTAPFRAFVMNIKQMPLFSCGTPLQNYQIVLHEGTNYIDVIVWNRDVCTGWNGGRGMIGIQNGNGSSFYYPPGRNIGPWSASQEAWRFKPVTNVNTITQVSWEVNGVLNYSTDTTVNIPMTDDTNVKLHVDYNLDCPNSVFPVIIDTNFELVKVTVPSTLTICEGQSTTLTATTSEGGGTFKWFKDGTEMPGITDQNISVNQSGTYVVEYTTPYCTAKSNVCTLTVNPKPVVAPVVITQCDNDNSGSESFNLTTYNDAIIANSSTYTISYHANYNDANSNLNPISSTYSANVGQSIVYVRVVNPATGCYNVTTITININADVLVTNVTDSKCDNDGNGSEVFDLSVYHNQIVTNAAAYTFTYHNTSADANSGSNTITSPVTVTSTGKIVYVRVVNNQTGCFSVATITLSLLTRPTTTNVTVTECRDAANTVDLATYNSQVSTNGTSFSFFTSQSDADSNLNAITTPNAYNIPLGTTVIYVRVQNASGCFKVATITFNYNTNPEITTVAIDGDEATVTVINGPTPYEYSLNGGTWQSGNVFTGLAPGNYTVTVRTPQGCTDTYTFTIVEIDVEFIPSIITPNGDGVNDSWVIPNIQYHPGSKIKVYDRYGKLIADIVTTNSSTVWDATYISEKLPSTTYWYEIKLTNGQEFKGYLVIKNRFKK